MLSFNLPYPCCIHLQLQHRSTEIAKQNETVKVTVLCNTLITSLLPISVLTHHAHTASCEQWFGVIILVHKQLPTRVSYNQLIQLR